MVRIKRGSRVYYSVVGHKGFHYPSNDNSYLVTEELEANQLSWITQKEDDRIPVTATLPDDPARVFWVKKSDLLD